MLSRGLLIHGGFLWLAFYSLLSGGGLQAAEVFFALDTQNRQEVRDAYVGIFNASEGVPLGWSGNYADGVVGDISLDYQQATLLRVNYYRAMAGVPAWVTLDSTKDAATMDAAFMMSVNQAISHNPPQNWAFWTQAAFEAAQKSNLAYGSYGVDAINGYMMDQGANNAAVGHRRWLLYPQTTQMGTGDVPGLAPFGATNVVWVINDEFFNPRPATRESYVAWPNPGYVPYQLMPVRWSFSLANADFSNASVTVSQGEMLVPVVLEPLVSFIGENTLVWQVGGFDANDSGFIWPRPSEDTTYQVSIDNVLVDDAPMDFDYAVTVFDPLPAVPEPEDSQLYGSSLPILGVPQLYRSELESSQTAYQWRELRDDSSFPAQLEAENDLAHMIDQTDGGYVPFTGDHAAAGVQAYRLGHMGQGAAIDQVLMLASPFLVQDNAQLSFASRVGFATEIQKALVQVSLDEGKSWTVLWEQQGATPTELALQQGSVPGEATYTIREVDLSAYAGRLIWVRFNWQRLAAGTYFTGANASVGWHMDSIQWQGLTPVSVQQTSEILNGERFYYTPSGLGSAYLQLRRYLLGQYPLSWQPVEGLNVVSAKSEPFEGLPVGADSIVDTIWFGQMYELNSVVKYHVNHGWVYLLGREDAMFIYDYALNGWLYTNSYFYPWVYHFGLGDYLYYITSTQVPERYYYWGAQPVSESEIRALTE